MAGRVDWFVVFSQCSTERFDNVWEERAESLEFGWRPRSMAGATENQGLYEKLNSCVAFFEMAAPRKSAAAQPERQAGFPWR